MLAGKTASVKLHVLIGSATGATVVDTASVSTANNISDQTSASLSSVVLAAVVTAANGVGSSANNNATVAVAPASPTNVSVGAPASATNSSGSLASTGADVSGSSLSAQLLVLLGSGLNLPIRRRRRLRTVSAPERVSGLPYPTNGTSSWGGMNEVTKRCPRWCDAAGEVVRECARELELAPVVLEQALRMLQRSLNVTLVRMCESFEAERQSADEELEHRQRELAFLATHDALTGLPNRTLILDRVEQLLMRSRREKTPLAALFVDLDNFKTINDSLGHAAGDELLQAVASRLSAVVRESDAMDGSAATSSW